MSMAMMRWGTSLLARVILLSSYLGSGRCAAVVPVKDQSAGTPQMCLFGRKAASKIQCLDTTKNLRSFNFGILMPL